MTFQASDFKRNHFLDLLDNNYLSIKPTYMKDSAQLKLLDHSNSLCARVTNHIPIGEYHLSLFSNKNFNCLCRSYLIKSRHYILHEYRRFNNYWNPNREFLSHFVVFLEFNPNTFFFHERITWQQFCYDLKILEWVKKRNLVQGLYKRTQQRTLYRIVYFIY